MKAEEERDLLMKVRRLSKRLEKLERLEFARIGPNNTYFDDFRFPATTSDPPGLVSDPTYDDTNVGWLFSASQTNMLQYVAQLTHTWKEGSTIYPHVHWLPTNTNTGNVLWRLEYKWTNIGDVVPGSWTTLDLVAAASGVNMRHQYDDFSGISGAGKTASSIIAFKLYRIGGDASDTYNDEALMQEFDFHFEADSLGETAVP